MFASFSQSSGKKVHDKRRPGGEEEEEGRWTEVVATGSVGVLSMFGGVCVHCVWGRRCQLLGTLNEDLGTPFLSGSLGISPHPSMRALCKQCWHCCSSRVEGPPLMKKTLRRLELCGTNWSFFMACIAWFERFFTRPPVNFLHCSESWSL